MKQIFTLISSVVVLSTSLLLNSCGKMDIIAPSANAATSVSYKDLNINISNFEATEIPENVILVDFSLLYANNVENIQVLSGNTPAQLCAFYQINIGGDLSKTTDFWVDDKNIKGATMYYMIKFVLSNGDWGFTPVYSLRVKQ